jgi:hypothetical protein
MRGTAHADQPIGRVGVGGVRGSRMHLLY